MNIVKFGFTVMVAKFTIIGNVIDFCTTVDKLSESCYNIIIYADSYY